MERVKKLAMSFVYAFRGIRFCIRHERNVRIHITATLYIIYFSQFYDFTRVEFAVLLLACALVISAEMLNTAIEVVIDKVSGGYNMFAKVGKDIAAGAVFVTALFAAVIGVVMLWDTVVFLKIAEYMISVPTRIALLLASVVLAVLFIFSTKKRGGTGVKNKK